MIQRIQSLYLILASGSIFGQFAVPYLSTTPENPAHTLAVFSDGVLNPMDNIGLTGLTALGGLVALIAVFLFKNRMLQGRITGGALVATIMLLVLAAVTIWQTQSNLPAGGTVSYQAGIGLPLLAAVLLWLATNAIRKDENLVRSMDRLR